MTSRDPKKTPGKKRPALFLAAAALLLHAGTLALCPAATGMELIEAVELSLTHNDNIKLQKMQVESSRGSLQAASGAFDLSFQSSINYSNDHTPLTAADEAVFGKSEITTRSVSHSESLGRQFRKGASARLGIEVARSLTKGGSIPTNRGRVFFEIRQPILKGRGREATGAQELSTKLEVKASRLDLLQTVSQSVQKTVAAYCQYAAALENLKIFQDSEKRAQRLVLETRTLIEADERPRSDLVQLLANLADKVALRVNAEQTLLEARHNLGNAIGMDSGQIPGLPDPVTSLSIFQYDGSPDLDDTQRYIDMALFFRTDFLAAKKREESADVLSRAAGKNLLPKLDVTFSAGISGLEEGSDEENYWSALGRNNANPDVSAGIEFVYPFGNNTANGELRNRAAVSRQRRLQTNSLVRQIGSSVAVALAKLHSSAITMAKAKESVGLYKETIEKEKRKFQLGASTLIDVTQFEDRLTSALNNVVSRQLEFAAAVIRLRLETGTLITRGQAKFAGYSLKPENLTTIPVVQIVEQEGEQ